jgi:hypothetical protein
MDFIVSYHLYNKMRKKELKESLKSTEVKEIITKPDQSERDIISKTCEKCGQEPYFCQCSNNMKLKYHNFNPEKDNY